MLDLVVCRAAIEANACQHVLAGTLFFVNDLFETGGSDDGEFV